MSLVDALKPLLKMTTLPVSGRVYEYLDVPAGARGQKTTSADPGSTPSTTSDGSHDTLLLLHGFPDSWYGWRHQILPWARRGYRIIVPSALGYGGTDKPTDPAAFTWRRLADDLAALIDVVVGKGERVAVVSHDWGAFTGWRLLQWHADRVKAFCSISIPFIPPAPPGSPFVPLEAVVARVPALAYQLYFNEPTAQAELDAHRERFLDLLYQLPAQLAQSGLGKPGGIKAALLGTEPVPPCPFWTAEDRAFYNDFFARSSFGSAINFYRSSHPKWVEETTTTTPPPSLPSATPKLVVHPTHDGTAIPEMMDRTASIAGTKVVKVDGAGHWVLQTHPEEMERLVGEWLNETLGREAEGGEGQEAKL